jgi:hypothetical protein
MFNAQLKSKLDALCTDIAAHLVQSELASGGARDAEDGVSYRSMSRSTDWWPSGLGRPGAVGAQNDLRYAVFPETRRLVLDDHGTISIYDTGNYRIFGVAQAQATKPRSPAGRPWGGESSEGARLKYFEAVFHGAPLDRPECRRLGRSRFLGQAINC